jgi:hypothetical protein
MGNNDPLGLNGGYLDNTPHMNFQQEMEQLKNDAKKVRQESDREFADQRNTFSA